MLQSGTNGAVLAGNASSPVSGLFVRDTRVLSELEIEVVGRKLLVSSATQTNRTRTVVFVPETARNEPSDILLTLNQSVSAAGLNQKITVHNTRNIPVTAVLRVNVAADFADQFVLRSDKRTFDRSGASTTATPGPAGVTFTYARERNGRQFTAGLTVNATDAPVVTLAGDEPAAVLEWKLDLTASERRTIQVGFQANRTENSVRALLRAGGYGPNPLRDRSLDDLEALRMPCPTAPGLTVLAAGIPWFLTLFGRDSLIASMLAEPALPGILDDVLLALAATQAQEFDPRLIAEPGKIVHELRVSELAVLDQIPYGRYYGSVDSTPLFLVALARCRDHGLIRELESSARAAVEWMLGPGGIHEHGFLRYQPDPEGLLHQGWKDSHDAIAHADGRIANGAIALCEVQGYAWRALTDTARLAREVWEDNVWAESLERTASQLRQRFRDEFWMPASDFPALALDGEGRRVEVVASNAGHLLYVGMLGPEDAQKVANRLLQEDMFTGWGLRTLSKNAVLYHPLSYHNGSVWPHDTMLAAIGMESYGLSIEARLLAEGLTDAAAHFSFRLPELFGGLDREEYPQPVAYPHAARPQAWSAAAGVAAAALLSDAQQAGARSF
jgi:glycogen debranching enzyme